MIKECLIFSITTGYSVVLMAIGFGVVQDQLVCFPIRSIFITIIALILIIDSTDGVVSIASPAQMKFKHVDLGLLLLLVMWKTTAATANELTHIDTMSSFIKNPLWSCIKYPLWHTLTKHVNVACIQDSLTGDMFFYVPLMGISCNLCCKMLQDPCCKRKPTQMLKPSEINSIHLYSQLLESSSDIQ